MGFLTTYTGSQPVNDFGLGFASVLYSATLAATTDTVLTIPSSNNSFKAVIKIGGAGLVWFSVNNVASVPVGATFAATNSELLTEYFVTCREVQAAQTLHFYTATAGTEVSVVLYALRTNG